MSLVWIYSDSFWEDLQKTYATEWLLKGKILEMFYQTAQYETKQNFLIANYLATKYWQEKVDNYLNRATLWSRLSNGYNILLPTSGFIKWVKIYITKTPDPSVTSRMMSSILIAALLPRMGIKLEQKVQEHIDLYIKYTK